MDRDNLLLGMIAVELGLVSPENLETCTKIQEGQLDPRPLGELFREKGFLTSSQLDRLLREQESRQKEFSESGLFGQIAVEKGFITVGQLGECIREQIRDSGEVEPMLGEVMLRKEYISLSQMKEVLSDQEKQLARCSGCDRYDLLSSRVSLEEEGCPVCGGRLEAVETRSKPPSVRRGPHSGNTTIHFKLPLTTLDKFQILGEIARGSMGIVFKAFDSTLDRTVALKVLKEGDADADYIKRLHREGAIAAKLHHPNVVTIHEVGQVGGLHYLCMDFIEGLDLLDHIRRKKLGRKECLRMMETISRAVHFAHVHGVIHRDLKPSNILVDDRGTPIITDFGLAKAADTRLDMTKEGTALGTPYYMPPEQVLGNVKKIDPRSDIYSIGVILYEILAERLPFTSRTTIDLYQKILHDEPEALRAVNDTIDPDLEAIVMKAIEKDPEFRYFSAEDLAMDLRRYLAGDPILAKRSTRARRVAKKWKKHRGRIATAATVALVAVGLTFFLLGWRQESRIRDRVEDARQFQRDGAWESAIREYREVLTLDPDRQEAFEGVRSCLRKLMLRADRDRGKGEWESALQRYRRILVIEEGYPEAIRGLERCRMELELVREKARLEAETIGRIRAEEEREKRIAAARPHYEAGFRKYHDAGIYMHLPGFEPEKLRQRYENGMKDFTRAIERAPDFAEAHFFLAKCCLHLGLLAEAKDGLSRVLELSPSHSAAWYERGKLDFLHGFRARYSELVPLIREGVFLAEVPLNRVMEKFWANARVDFENALSYSSNSSPRLDERFLARGYVDLVEGRFHDAVVNFTRVMGVNPVNADAFFGRAYAHLFLGDISLCLFYADRALLLQPDFSSARVVRSLAYFAREDFAATIFELQGDLDRIPATGVLEMLASVHESLGQYAEALVCVDRILDQFPDDLVIRGRRALLLLRTEQMEDALLECQAILGRDWNDVVAHSIAARAYHSRGETGKAAKHYRESMRLEPGDDKTISDYASMLLELDEADRAFELAGRALSLNRENVSAWLIRAMILLRRGKVDEAVVRFERGLRLDPGRARAHLEYGRALLRAGRTADALRALRRAKELDATLASEADRFINKTKGE